MNVVVWEGQRKDGGFSPFPPHDSASIEAAYGTQLPTCQVGGSTVDLKNMKMKLSRRELHRHTYTQQNHTGEP